MQFETAQASHIGGRNEQQDRAEISVSHDHDSYFLVVADGMGGHKGGSLAAQAVIETAASLWKAHQENAAHSRLLPVQLCLQAHEAVNTIGRAHNLHRITD